MQSLVTFANAPPSQWGGYIFKVYVVLALRAELDCSAQWQRIPAVPNHQASLQCPTTKHPCSAQPPSIPAVLNGNVYPCSVQLQSIPAVTNSNRRVFLQCQTVEYPCRAQPLSIPAVPNHRVSLQCPIAEYPCSAKPQSIPAVPTQWQYIPSARNRRVLLQCPNARYPCSAQPQKSLPCPTTEYPCSAQPPSIPAVPNHQASLQCSMATFPCSAQPQSIPAVTNPTVSLQCPWQRIPAVPKPTVSLQCSTAKPLCRAQPLQCRTPTAFGPAVPNCNFLAVHLQCCKEDCLVWCVGGQGGGRHGKHYISHAITALGWGCSKYIIQSCFLLIHILFYVQLDLARLQSAVTHGTMWGVLSVENATSTSNCSARILPVQPCGYATAFPNLCNKLLPSSFGPKAHHYKSKEHSESPRGSA